MMTSLVIPEIRGRVVRDAVLAPMTWFRVGGPAEFLVRPADAEDLCAFLKELPLEMPVTVIGAASNLIVRDGGINGVVIKLARGFGGIVVEEDGIIAGAAAGVAGLEFLSGIPGTIGGAVAMNAGAYGGDMAQVLDWVEIVTRSGDLVRVPAHTLGLSYRHANLPADAVVVRARLRARRGDAKAIAAKMAQIKSSREASQPVRARTGGSTFANPPDQKAWELIDAAGCRGLKRGGAQVSELHCNFLINTGEASAADLEGLGEDLRARVEKKTGVSLRWEIKRIGVPG